MLGPGSGLGFIAAADSTSLGAMLYVQYTNPSSLDTVFVAQQGSPDNYVFSQRNTVVALTGMAGYFTLSGQTVNQSLDSTSPYCSALGIGPIPSGTFQLHYPNNAFAMPFSRYVMRANAAGQVMGKTKVWIGRWVAPGSELAD